MNTVSIHAPARGATLKKCQKSLDFFVSIHAPARGATPLCPDCCYQRASFNPRTRTGCDIPITAYFPSLLSFQSTHPHGVRRFPGDGIMRQKQFQSTHPHGVRRCQDEGGRCFVWVSIHAPARGATIPSYWFRYAGAVSIHAPARGATPTQEAFMTETGKFQSTHPHGVRHTAPASTQINSCFNPRTRTGCDLKWEGILKKLKVSIHAPARGATARKARYRQSYPVSIHAPARGATRHTIK